MTHWKIMSMAVAVLALSGCALAPNWKHPVDPPLSTAEGREQICLYNLERLLDAKEEWARETGARPGTKAPSAEVLAHKYLRRYDYGRRAPCDDDTVRAPVNVPRCPSGGEYVIGKVGELPRCTVHGDLLRDYDARLPHFHTH
ncbi:MAG: hypothetical protein ACP5QZ_03230 [Candidatus Sumerlaeaceae bacterium]|jgi:hypothetical protein